MELGYDDSDSTSLDESDGSRAHEFESDDADADNKAESTHESDDKMGLVTQVLDGLPAFSDVFESVSKPDYLKVTVKPKPKQTKAPEVVEKATEVKHVEAIDAPMPVDRPSQTRPSESSKPASKSLKRMGTEILGTRMNAKERVKRQRLSGQSGIGEDFKTWRSEEEMKLRQHYD